MNQLTTSMKTSRPTNKMSYLIIAFILVEHKKDKIDISQKTNEL